MVELVDMEEVRGAKCGEIMPGLAGGSLEKVGGAGVGMVVVPVTCRDWMDIQSK